MNQAKVSIRGNLIKDPSNKQVNNSTVVNMAVAVRTTKKQPNSQYFDNDLYNVEVWGKQAESLLNYVQKGTQVLVYGEMYMESFQNRNGETVTAPHIRASSVEALSGTKTNNAAAEPTTNAVEQSDVPF